MNKKLVFLMISLSIIVIEIIISLIPKLKNFDIKNLLETTTLAITSLGVFSESKKKKLRKSSIVKSPKIYTVNISFESGIYGGITGGILSGTIMAIAVYYQQLHPPLIDCLKIIPYCAIIGCLFGGLIYLGRKLLVSIHFLNILWANFLGCLIACLIAGIFSGMLGMWLFGDAPFDFIGYNKMIVASIIAALCLILGALIYDYEGKLKYILFSLIVALILSAFISMVGFLIFEDSAISSYLDETIYSSSKGDLIKGGAIIGLINGFVFGLVIGFTVMFYKYWKFAENQNSGEQTVLPRIFKVVKKN